MNLYVVTVSVGYDHGGKHYPVDSVIEMKPEDAVLDVSRGFLLSADIDNPAYTPEYAAFVAAYLKRKAEEPPPEKPAIVVEVKPDPIAEAEASKAAAQKAEDERRKGVTAILNPPTDAKAGTLGASATSGTQVQKETPNTGTPVQTEPPPGDDPSSPAKKK